MCLVVNKGLKLELLPSKSMIQVLEQNIGNARFIWNNILGIYCDLYELFKPFGKLNFEMGKERLGEVYILDPRTGIPIMKLQGRVGNTELRITILKTPIAARTKTVEIEQKFKNQITKYQLCVGCHACENACKHNAIKLIKNGPGDSDYKYVIDEEKCIHCYECINHYPGGCFMRRVLLPRGKGYSKNE